MVVNEGGRPASETTYKKKHPRRTPRPRQTGPMMCQPAFNWKAPDGYVELLNFEMGVANVLQAEAYDFSEGKVPIIKNWLG